MVAPGGYSSEVIRLTEGEAALRSDAVAVQQEADYIASLMTGFSPERRWDSLFLLPTTGVMTSAFGTARSFDGGQTYNTYHSGADFLAKTGTPIYAPADGLVMETGQLTVRGNFTVIDHGWGVYTGYWHQSSILVELGDSVSAGQQIGLVGRTGSATAAHLHWEMWVGGVPVDPLQWVREEFP
jgi:murein DD-endopeptidase MepM/ murein hydrolase activator NlpD